MCEVDVMEKNIVDEQVAEKVLDVANGKYFVVGVIGGIALTIGGMVVNEKAIKPIIKKVKTRKSKKNDDVIDVKDYQEVDDPQEESSNEAE